MPRITKLKTLTGLTLAEWPVAKPSWDKRTSIWSDARGVVADHCDCRLSQIDYDDTPAGECFTVDGEPVAYLEHVSIVDLRPLMMGA